MPKKKKSTSKSKKKSTAANESSPFWPLAAAVLMFVVALFLLIGGFGVGGPLPINLFGAAYLTLGWAAWLTPVALVFFGVHKFVSEDRKVPLAKTVSMFALMILSAAWVQVVTVTKVAQHYSGGHGGAVGEQISKAALQLLDVVPASILFLVFAVLAFFFAFGISPSVILRLADLIKKDENEDTDLTALKSKIPSSEFKLNEGVPVIHHNEDDSKPTPPRLTSFRNSAQKLAPLENHEALTTASDPDWKFPGINLLSHKEDKADAGDVNGNAEIIRSSLANFNIDVTMEGANVGPTVTQYTLRPPTGVKLTKITALENNLALDLAAESIRMEAPIPGKRAVGIEVPNLHAATVRISSMLQTKEFADQTGPLAFVIGKDIAGKPVVADLAKMPHLLVAGQTGSGKSVMINSFLTSLLYRNSPSDLKLILVDPKQVEMAPYNDLPHLLTPVINEPEKCISALKWAVAEMERRLRTMAEVSKRNINEYNALKQEEGMPHIVIVIDELADLMMMAARDVEALIVRLAQKARAAGIHLVLATQSPRVSVITGLIKANVPARIAFTVSQEVESRIILDQSGAEKLLGKGDMLFITSSMPKPIRVQAALIEESETAKITKFIRDQRPPQYDDEVISQPVQLNGRGGTVANYGASDADDDMWRDAVKVVIDGHKASTSLLQRRLRVGYARAARLIESMEEQGIVGPADGARPREVLVSSLDEVFGDPSGSTDSGEDDGLDSQEDPLNS